MAMPAKHQLLQLFLVIQIAAEAASQPIPHCPNVSYCGNLSIPYPFGTSEGCYLDHSFFINCTHHSKTPTPFLPASNLTVLKISLDDAELTVSGPVVRDCYDMKGNSLSTTDDVGYNLSHFYISSKRNKLTTLGCGTVGVLMGQTCGTQTINFTSENACGSFCNSIDDVNNGSCSDAGCCHTQISEGVSCFEIHIGSWTNYTSVHDFNPCGYAFVVEEEAYEFSLKDLKNFENETVPMVLDWAVRNHTCQEAQRYIKSYACKAEHSECLNSTHGIGYRCKCKEGFQGNPYVLGGCEDIDECNMEPHSCWTKMCQNFPGSFKCLCPKGYEGDGRIDGTGCHRKDNFVLIFAPSASLSLLALLVGSLCLCYGLRKRKLNQMRRNYFQNNGGTLLQQRIASGSAESATIFTFEELKKATNNFDEAGVIGKGGHGTVYKGILSDSRVVAIKKSKISSQTEIEQFINEVVVLSQINHRNVVKLLGCCLETKVPLLVYEFISNGTLYHHIHAEGQGRPRLSWSSRLRIATETAEALAYLHSAASTPIIHRDVKTANILLDDNLIAKVSDFGASKLVPLDHAQLTTLVQGTFGYFDPEYFQTSKLTEKSDVYSFGVVLAELLTSEKVISFDRSGPDKNLSMYFISSLMEGRLTQILDNDIVNDANVEQITEVANLTRMCLMLKGEERPTMKEVAMELVRIRIKEKHSLEATNVHGEETENSLGLLTALNIVDSESGSGGSSIIKGFDSVQKHIVDSLGDGR